MGHQGGKIFDKEERLKLYKDLEYLEYEFLELPRPDLIIFLYVPYKKVAELRAGRDEPADQHEASPLHIRNAEHAYLELAEIISVETDYKIGKSGINHHFIKIKELVSKHKNSLK